MAEASAARVDWVGLWRSGDLGRFCFISLGILLHAGCETMLGAVMPALVADIGGVQLVGWSFAIYEVGSIMGEACYAKMPDGERRTIWEGEPIVINTLVNMRGMSQHTFLEHQSDTVLGTRSILTNRVTAFFMCNENYHLEHHLYPGIPWYNLPRVHQALGDDLAARGAPFVSSYFAFVREFVVKSLRRSPLWKAKARG